MEIVIAVVAGIVGLLVGGLINALADDLPVHGLPRAPHYPDDSPRPVSAWLGVTAFLTGQRASSFDPTAWLSWRHPITEIVTAGFFAAMAYWLRDETNLVPWMVYVAVLILITVIDVEHRLILFVVVLPACLFALIVAAVSPGEEHAFSDYLLGGLEGFVVFFAMFLGGVAFSQAANTGEIAFGFGDVMLATLSGLMLGWRAFIFAAVITVFVGALGAVVYLAGRALMRRRYALFTPLPYGPYIVIATLIMLLFRDDVQHLLQGG
jgi:leader peptidase (prepilin peptidase)/N-methyltransferase